MLHKPIEMPRHEQAIRWVDALVLELKLHTLAPQAHPAPGMELLNEWFHHRQELERCHEPTAFH